VIITAVTDSRQSPNITVQSENHGNHGDREFVIYIHPYWWNKLLRYATCGISFPCYRR